MLSKNDTLFWKKKEYVSFLLSILVFFIHSHFAQDISNDSLISMVNHKVSYFFSDSITRFAVPMFFLLSGISFFKDYNNQKYWAKIRSRLFTLVVPYLLWNTIWMLWEIFTSYSFIANLFGSTMASPFTLANILKGVFFYGYNAPFWFIFDLIIFSFMAPLVFVIVKNKYIGIIFTICLSILSLFGIHLPIDVFYYPMAIVFYLLGAIIGYHFFDFACQKSSKKTQVFSLIFLVAYILLKNVVPQQIHINNYFTQTLVYTIVAFSLWNVVDMFIERLKPRAIYRRSFAIYAMHLPLSIAIMKIFSFCIPQSEWLEIPKFVIMIIVTLVIINFVCAFLERFAPKIYATLMGNRTKKAE